MREYKKWLEESHELFENAEREVLRGAQDAARIQTEQLAIVAAELAEARNRLSSNASADGANDEELRRLLEEVCHEREQLCQAQENAKKQAEQLATELADTYPDQEIEVIDGGQPHYHYVLSAE